MAFTVTNRGYAYRSDSSSNSLSDTFTPTTGSLLICVIAGQAGTINSISGHVTWTRVYNYELVAGRNTEVWAGIVGGSPSSAQISVNHGYEQQTTTEFYEITGADTSGTTAAAFGVSASRYDYATIGVDYTLTLSSFASSANMTFAWCWMYGSGGAVSPVWSDGTFTTGTQRTDFSGFQSAWLFSEDPSVVLKLSGGTKNRSISAIEIKLASGGGGEVSGTPLQNLGSGFGPARAARINGVLQ